MKSPVRMTRPKAGAAAAVVVALAILVFAAAPALAVRPKFSAPVGFTVGDSPHSVVVGDFNGDGKLDVVTASHSGNTISVLLGLGNGKLAAARSVTVGSHPSAIVVADFNGDGRLDLAVANSGSNTVSILHGNGAGGFTLAQTVAVGAGPMSMASGDFTRDGKPDLAVTCYTGQTISVLIQDGAGSFVAKTLPAPTSPPAELEGPRAIAVADADHDGKLDIVFTTSFVRNDAYIENLGIYYGDGAGGFDPSVQMVSVPDGVMDLSVFTVNGPAASSATPATTPIASSGLTEIVGASWTANQVWLSTESAPGSRDFTAPAPASPIFDAVGYPGSLVVQDLNGDGIPDIAVTVPGANAIKIALSRYRVPYWELAANVKTTVTIPAGERPGPMVAADLNRDGTADLVVGDYGSNKVSVLTKTWPLRSGAAFRPFIESDRGTGTEFAQLALGDLNDDGSLDVASTLSSLLGASDGTFGAPVAHPAGDDQCLVDVNGDGMLDLVAADTAANQVSVALGVGNGTFAAATPFATGVGPTRVLVADVNADGKPDIVTTNAAGSVSVLLGDGAGSFAAHLDTTVGADPLGVAAGDVNRDGKLDLVVADSGGSAVSILLGDGLGGFTSTDKTVGTQPVAVGLGDFTRDGKLDLVVGTSAGNVSVLPGNGVGGFGDAVTVASPAGATELAIGDFTTDGKLDVVAAAPHVGGTADASLLSGDGAGGFVSPFKPLNLTVPGDIVTGLASADFNHDGVSDLIVGGKDPGDATKGRLYLFLNDTFAPVTSASAVGFTPIVAPDHTVYWTNKAATVTLTAVDPGAGPRDTWFQYKTDGFTKGTSVAIKAPADHSADGVAPLAQYSDDKVGNVEDYLVEYIGVDTLKPALTDTASSKWTNKPVTTVTLTAADTGSGLVKGSRLAITGWGFSVAPGGTEGGATVFVPAPYDHVNDGVHAITFKTHDNVGNYASKTFDVRIDTLRPTVSASASLTARSGGAATLRYRVNDGANGCGAAVVKVIVRNARGATVEVWKLGTRKTNTWLTLEFPPPAARGHYTVLTYATDLAGNVQQKVGQSKLTVK